MHATWQKPKAGKNKLPDPGKFVFQIEDRNGLFNCNYMTKITKWKIYKTNKSVGQIIFKHWYENNVWLTQIFADGDANYIESTGCQLKSDTYLLENSLKAPITEIKAGGVVEVDIK